MKCLFITEEVLESENEAYQRAVGFYAKFFNVSEEEAREYVQLVDALKEEKSWSHLSRKSEC